MPSSNRSHIDAAYFAWHKYHFAWNAECGLWPALAFIEAIRKTWKSKVLRPELLPLVEDHVSRFVQTVPALKPKNIVQLEGRDRARYLEVRREKIAKLTG